MRNSKQKLFEVLDIEDDVVEMQYGGGLSDAYSTLSDRRQNMYGMGQTPSQMSSVFQDPMESSAFSPVNMEQGGDIVVPQERMINNQPHQLSYINPQEAKLLKDLGGSGRRVDGIPAYFDTGMENDFEEGTGETLNTEFTAEDQADADVGASNLPTEEGKEPEDSYISYDSRGRAIQAKSPADIALNEINIRNAARLGGQDYRDRFDKLGKIDPDSKFTNLQLMQRGIDRDLYNKAGIPLANFLENRGLATFGKGMRGMFEAYTPGDALYRNKEDAPEGSKRGEYDPEVLGGNVDLTDNPNKAAIQEFGFGIRYAKSGDTIADVTQSMKDSGRFSDEQISNASQSLGYSPNSTAQASQVYDSLNDARGSGMLQGLGLIAGGIANPGGFMNSLLSSYDDKGKNTTPVDTAIGQVLDAIGVSGLANKFGIDKDNKVVSGIGTALDFAQRGPGALLDIYEPSRRGVSNKNEDMTSVINPEVNQDLINSYKGARERIDKDKIDALDSAYAQIINKPNKEFGQMEYQSGRITPANRTRLTLDEIEDRNEKESVVQPTDNSKKSVKEVANAIKNDTPSIKAPEQNIFERGISALVNLFGGPEAAFRNNIDTSFDSGNDQPERRVAPPLKIPEVLSAAIEQAEPIPVEDSGLSARELSLGPQVNTLILQGVDPSTAVRQVGIDQGEFTVAQILKLLGVS